MSHANTSKKPEQLMDEGDIQEIMNNVYSNRIYYRIFAIMSGVKYRIKTEEFIKAVKDAYENGSTDRLGVIKLSVQDVAAGALDVLGIKKYDGDHPLVQQLIDVKFNV